MAGNLLIIGASGLVGGALLNTFKDSDFNVYGTSLEECQGLSTLDICKKQKVKEIFDKIKPDILILTAALTNVDYCEDHQSEAWSINIGGTKNVVELCKKFNSKLVFMSTDYIFDGKNGPYNEEDIPNPINFYGKTKLEGENLVKKLKDYLIIRTTWVYDCGFDSRNFIARMISFLKEGNSFSVPLDQYANPTLATDLASGIKELIIQRKKGVYNITGLTCLSKYDFAVKVAEKLSLDKTLIKGIKTKLLNQKAKRPLKAGLKTEKIKKDTSLEILDLNTSLEKLKQNFDKNEN